ncbi:transposase, partial [Streptomyces sp. NPDC001817]|uniref:transposase n=1 Tax=Streptomyces sp. NPDC001817 TaxID=3154398 RepID=UPI00331EACB4
MTDLVERLVPDELWVLFRRVVPPTEVKRPQGGGRRRAGDRECLAAIIFVATSGCTWRQLPPVFGPAWPTVYRRFAQWSRERVWARLHRILLDELGARGKLDWSRCAIDSVSPGFDVIRGSWRLLRAEGAGHRAAGGANGWNC